MTAPTADTCALCAARNDRAHEAIEATLSDVRAAQVAAEIQLARVAEDLAHVAGRRNGRGWWRTPVLAAGLGALVTATGWGVVTLIGHGSRLAVIESAQAAPVPQAPTVPRDAGHGARR